MQALTANSLCVAGDFWPWQTASVESDDIPTDKNGGPNNLRAWRLHRGLTQAALAEMVGTTANMIQYLEGGERALSLKWLRRLAPALETTVGHLADHSPEDAREVEVLDFWAKRLDKDQRRQLVRIAEALAKTGTDDE